MLKILKVLIYICFSTQSGCPKILTHFTSRQLSLLYWCFAIRLHNVKDSTEQSRGCDCLKTCVESRYWFAELTDTQGKIVLKWYF